jgi:YD repeat-containing protein
MNVSKARNRIGFSSSDKSKALRRARSNNALTLSLAVATLVLGLPTAVVTLSARVASAQTPAAPSARVASAQTPAGHFGFTGSGPAPTGYPSAAGAPPGHRRGLSRALGGRGRSTSLLISASRLRPLATNSAGDVLTVSDVRVGSFSTSVYQSVIPSSNGGNYYEDCEASSPTYGGALVPICASIYIYDAMNTTDHDQTTTDNSASISVYDECHNLVAYTSLYGAYITGTDPPAMETWDDAGGEPILLPASGVCFGPWTATYSFTQKFHDGDTLTDSASATFTVTGAQEVPLVGGGYLLDGDPTGQCACATPTVGTLARIDPGTGDIVEPSEDISVPGPGVPLELSRTYDSGYAQQQVLSGTATEALGYGWFDNLGMTLTENTTTHVATVVQENGSQVSFAPYASGSSPSWCSGVTNYCAEVPRDLATLELNGSGSWTMVRYAAGRPTTFNFSSSGHLTSESDQAGDSLTETSEAAGSGACPSAASSCTVWASSASGRSLTLAFDSSGRLDSATDGGGNTAAYCYFGQSCAGGATHGGSEDLYSAELPGGATTVYGYDYTDSNADFVHDVLTETLPAGGTVNNTYNSSGQLLTQDAPSDDVTLSYTGNNQSVVGGSTAVSTWPTGTSGALPAEVVNYQFSSGALVAETTGYETSAAATTYDDVDLTSTATTMVQNGNINVSLNTIGGDTSSDPMNVGDVTLSSDPAGNETDEAYNADNQVWCEVIPAEVADGVTCPSSPPSSPPSAGASDPNLGATISFYNSAGELTAQTDPLGNTTTYSYTSGVSGVPNGLEYCSIDPVDYQKSVTCPAYGASHATGTATSSFDSAGDQTSSTDPDGNTTHYYYALSAHPGLVSSSVSPDGTTTTYTYNGAGQVTEEVVSFGSYSATTLNAYDAAGNQFCTVGPYEYALGVTCPSSPPSSPPTPSSDPYLGATITTYNSANQPVQLTNPIGGITYTAYDQAGNEYCTVAPAEAALSVTCPSTPPSSEPTVGSDPYLGATITSYNTSSQVAQVTNPLGGINLDQYDGDGNVLTATAKRCYVLCARCR